jgi:hypothetical protein
VVVELLQRARANNIQACQDMPYMPMESCSLKEAVIFLRREKHLLIQDGCLYLGSNGKLHAKMWGKGDLPTLTLSETLRLLRANYP